MLPSVKLMVVSALKVKMCHNIIPNDSYTLLVRTPPFPGKKMVIYVIRTHDGGNYYSNTRTA